MKKLIIILAIFLSITKCAVLQKMKDNARQSVYESIDKIGFELKMLAECNNHKEYINQKSIYYCRLPHLNNLKKYYDDAGAGIWYLSITERKKLGFDIDDIKSYIIMKLYFLGIKDFEL